MKIVIQIKRGVNGFYKAVCPALPGCAVIADSRDDAERKIAKAIEGYLASLDVALPRELDRRFKSQWATVA